MAYSISTKNQKTLPLIAQGKNLLTHNAQQLQQQWLPKAKLQLKKANHVFRQSSCYAFVKSKQSLQSAMVTAIGLLPEPRQKLELSLESNFQRRLLGDVIITDKPASNIESRIIDCLESSLLSGHSSKKTPALPKIMTELLKSLRDDVYPWNNFRAKLNTDPAMEKSFMQENHYDSELLVLPTDKSALKKLLLRISIENVMEYDRDQYGQKIRNRVMTQALKTAISAEQLATEGYGDSTEAWLAGLVQNIAQINIVQQMRHFQLDLGKRLSLSFINDLQRLNALISYQIAVQWKLPKSICVALKEQATLGLNSKLSALGEGLYLASRIAMVHSLNATGEQQTCPDVLREFAGIDRLAICESTYESLCEHFKHHALHH